MSNAAKFKEGDRVRHRASGQLAIVTVVHRSCVLHSGLGNCFGDKRECDLQPNGRYNLATGLGHDVYVKVKGNLLELADSPDSTEESREMILRILKDLTEDSHEPSDEREMLLRILQDLAYVPGTTLSEVDENKLNKLFAKHYAWLANQLKKG